MSDSIWAREPLFQVPRWKTIKRDATERQRPDSLAAELRASLARVQVLQEEKRDLSERQATLAKEFEHRFFNGLQLIASLLTLQSRTATTAEAGAQLTVAAHRVVALGRVHHQLHVLDDLKNVEIQQFLVLLCQDLSGLLFPQRTDSVITVEAEKVVMPAVLASPLGFIINELVTNAVKYADGPIIVRLESAAPAGYALSVLDNGTGLPAGFDAAKSKGLGMKIVRSLVQQIGGVLEIDGGDHSRGARFTVTFCCPS